MGRFRHLFAVSLGTLMAVLPYLDLPLEPLRDPPPARQAPQPPRVESPPLDPRPVVYWGNVLPAAERIVYLIDFSSSMTPDRWNRAREEVARSLRNNDGEFCLAAYDCGLRRFSDDWSTDVEGAVAWLYSLPNPWERGGGTGTAQAVLYALSLEPNAILLCTDGAPGACGLKVPGEPPYVTHARVIRQHNPAPIPIHCAVFPVDEYADRFAHQVAGDSGGTCTRSF